MHDQSVLRVTAIAQFDGGEVVPVGDELGDTFIALYLWIQDPSLDGIGSAVVHTVGKSFVASEDLLSGEMEGRPVLAQFNADTSSRERV